MGPSPLLSPPTIAPRTSSLAWRAEGESPAGPSRTLGGGGAHTASSSCSSPPSSRRINIQNYSDDGHYQKRSTSSASGPPPPPSSFGSLAGGASGGGLEGRRSSFNPATSTTLAPPTSTTDAILQRRPSFSNQPPSNPPTDPLPPLPPSSPSSSSDRPPLDARFSSTSSPSPTILLSPLPRVPPSSYGGSLALMQSSLTRRRSSLGLGEGQGGVAAGGVAGLKRRPSFSPNHPPNIPLPPLPTPSSSSPTDSTFSSQSQSQHPPPPTRVSRASSPLFPSPKIPLPPLPPTSPSSIRSVSSQLQPPRSPRPSSSLSNHSTSTTNPPPHPPPSIPLPTLPRGPSAFRGRGTPVNSMDGGASSPAGSRGLDSPLKGVFGDGSPVRDFFASVAGSPPGHGAWSGEMKRSLSSEEREKVLLEGQHQKRTERRFELTVGKMHDARIIGPSLDPNPISPISPPNRSLSPLPPPPSSLPRAPSPLSTSVPKPSPLLPLRTRLSLSPPSHPKPLPPPPSSADQPTANTTSPSTSSDYSNRSSTFSTSTVSSRSSTSSFGHLLPPLMPTTSTFLHHGVGVPASKKPDLPSVIANPMSPEEGQGAFVVEMEMETEPEGGRTSPDVVEMRRTTARRVSSTGTKGAGEGAQEDGWGEESLLVEVREGGGVLEEEDGESGEESDLDLKSPLATLGLQSHFLSPNSRLLAQPSPNASSRRVSAISSSSAPLVGDGWGGSDSEEDDFLSSSPGRHMSGSTYKGRSSLPPSIGGSEAGRLGFGAGDVRRKKMSSQEMVASFPKPPSTPTTSNRASLASVVSGGTGGSEDSHGTGGSLQFRLSIDSTNHQHHHFHPSPHSTTTTATTTPTHLNQITTNSTTPSRPSSDSSTYFPRPPIDRSPSPTSSRPSSLFSIGTEAGSVYSLGGKLLPRPRRGGEDDAELGEVWGPVEIAYAEMKAEGVAAGGAGSGGGEEKGSREEWEKAAEMLRERNTLSVQPVGATRAGAGGGVPLRRVSSLMQPGYGGRQTQLGLGRPTLGGGGGAMRRVSNGDLTVGTRIGTVASSTPARSLIPPPQKRQIATSLTIRKPVPAYTPHTPPRPPPSTLPPPAPTTTPAARRIASVSHLRPPSHIAFPSSPNTTSKLPTPSSSSILPPKSPLRKPSVSISRRTSTSSFVPPIASLFPLPKPTVSITTSLLPLPKPTLTPTSSLPVPTNSLAPPSPSKQVFPPTEPLRIIKKNASQLTLRPPPSPTASSGSASTISVALPSPTSPTSPTIGGTAGPKRRMSKVPLPPSAFRLPSQPLVRSP